MQLLFKANGYLEGANTPPTVPDATKPTGRKCVVRLTVSLYASYLNYQLKHNFVDSSHLHLFANPGVPHEVYTIPQNVF